MHIERLKAENYDELMDFINMVFSQDLIRVHFQEDLPLLFGRDDRHMHWQYAARDDAGRIRAAIGVIPYTYVVGGQQFTARTITNVATHYQHAGKGYMQSILKRVLADMREEGVDFAILSGHRERYRFWGFESAGVTATASFAAYNAVNRAKRGEKADFHFELITEHDPATIRRCLELFDREPQHYLRTQQDFLLFQNMWRAKAYAVKDAQDQFCGYLNYCDHWDPSIRELLLEDWSTAPRVMASFLSAFGLDNVPVTVSPFGKEQLGALYDAAEIVTSAQTCRMNLLRPRGLLAACLNAKRDNGGYMPEGELVIESMLGRLLIRNDGGFTVTDTDRKPDLTVPGFEIYSLLFGPSSQVIPPYARQLGALGAWFPAPLYIHATDRY